MALDHAVDLHLAGCAQQPFTVRWRVWQIGERGLLGDKPGALFSAEGWPVIHAAQELRLASSAAALSCLAIGEVHPVGVRMIVTNPILAGGSQSLPGKGRARRVPDEMVD